LNCKIQTSYKRPVFNKGKHSRRPEETRQNAKEVNYQAVVVSLVDLSRVQMRLLFVLCFVDRGQAGGHDGVDSAVDAKYTEDHHEDGKHSRIIVRRDVVTIA